ncbi:hereditary hemochromatosis protein homolog isoform X2 [Trichosurus vulpecula]|uniref:hereditary hemochromatosis protein homolog isoform X2 n=1 Tax=Trichosurus vulpecula TaxID=9337 RepID=UPI00186ADD50|nr:hereditary hemochromatosis protein homolog isoform X2 [Trichosurus vulpecula]
MAPICRDPFWLLTALGTVILNCQAFSSESPKLWYNLTAVFHTELKQFSYVIHGYLNNRKFLSFDVKSQNVDSKSLEKVNIEYLIEKEKELEEILWIIDEKSDEKERSRTLQVILGCQLQMDGNVRGFWNYRYNGQDLLSLSLENLTWTGASPEAQEVKKTLEKNKSHLNIRAYVLGDCCAYLRNYQRENPEETEMATPALHLPDPTMSGSMFTGANSTVIIISIISLAIIRK